MPDAGELFGGFWDVSPSPVIDDYAAASTILSDAAVNQTAKPTTRTLALRASDALPAYAGNGRAVTSYPLSGDEPAWVTGPSNATGPVWCRGVDYEIVSGRILFDTDPFTAFDPYTVWVDGSPVAGLTLWYGRSAEPVAPPAPEEGTFTALVAAVATACDSPASLSGETVTDLFEGPDGWRVVTDARVYRLGPNDLPSVAVGATLAPGDPVGSAWVLTRLGPSAPDLTYVTTPATFLQGATTGAVTWYNYNTGVVVDTVSGRTRVRFRLGAASSGDFDAFWTASHANGIGNGFTLAQAMDTRTNPTTEPTAGTLPSFVNPMQFLCRELLAGDAWQLVVDTARLGPNALDSAGRSAAAARAAGPYTAVFYFDDAVPELTPHDPG